MPDPEASDGQGPPAPRGHRPWSSARPSVERLVFPLAGALVLILGGVLRLQPWRADAGVEGEATSAQPIQVISWVELPEGLGETVFIFYDSVDRGQYEEAFEVSLEAKWEPMPGGGFQNVGLTSKEEFVESLTSEFGANGVDLNVVAKQILDAQPFTRDDVSLSDRPELAVLDELAAGMTLGGMYEVKVTGALGDVCTPLRFDKQLLVADLGRGQWRVLLPGVTGAGDNRKEEWFTNTNAFAGEKLLSRAGAP